MTVNQVYSFLPENVREKSHVEYTHFSYSVYHFFSSLDLAEEVACIQTIKGLGAKETHQRHYLS